MNKKYLAILFQISAVLLLISLVARIFEFEYSSYMFAVAAAGVAIVKLNNRYEGKNPQLKRLYLMETIAAVLLLLGSYLMFKDRNEWILCVTISGFLQLYTSFRIPGVKE